MPVVKGGFDETAAEATNAMAGAVFAPSEEVADVLTTGVARMRYAGWFGLGVTSKAVSEWYVEAALTDAAKTRLAEAASEVSAVTVADGVTHVGKNVFAGFADTVKVNGIPSSFYRMMGGAYGMSNTKQGFFYLMSKPAVPSDKGGVPFQPTPRLMSGEW